ncbi:MAG: DUF4390 domain-containing protein [Gammaproteobacteria bacterium]|nr:DUF4390 domain-containing protein [Gammaproteobacteria bacterium]
MPVSAKTETASSKLILVLTALLLGQWVQAAGITVRDISSAEVNGEMILSAQLDFELSKEALKALDHGVAMDIVIEIEALQQRRWIWDRKIAEHSERFRLERQALSKHYLVTHNYQRRSFLSLREALQFIGAIREYPLVNTEMLQSGHSYHGRLRAWLDIESLPAPMRPTAYISSHWHVVSAWHEWPLKS